MYTLVVHYHIKTLDEVLNEKYEVEYCETRGTEIHAEIPFQSHCVRRSYAISCKHKQMLSIRVR